MAQPPDKNPFASPRPGPSGGTASTDPKGLPVEPAEECRNEQTLLLSDVPSVETLFSEPAARETQRPAPTQTFASDSSMALAAVGQRYEILGEAGRGSMGNVYKARDRETGEIVALKLLKPEIASDQQMMDRFKNELLFARRITHKNVCRVYDFNRFGSVACTSMEYVEGESLRSVISRFGGLPVRKATDVALQICAGLKEAHVQGIVHRDLKPENVMIDAQGRVKLMDFGIARSMEAATRLTGAMVGTPAYMAPEQVAGKQVDYRTDIYSLGLILFEMFTGRQAFQADTAIAMAMKQMRDAPPLPHEIEPLVPAHIERTILRCLEKEPARRFATVEELEKALRGTPAVAATGGAPKFPGFNFEPVMGASAGTNGTPRPAPKSHHSPFLWFVILVLLVGGAAAAQVKWPDWETRGLRDARTFWHATKQHAAQDWQTAAEIKAEHDAESAAGGGLAPAEAGAKRAAPASAPVANPAGTAAAIIKPSAKPGARGAAKTASVTRKEVFPRVELPGKNPASPEALAGGQTHSPQAQQSTALVSGATPQATPKGAARNVATAPSAASGDPFANKSAAPGKSAPAGDVQQRADRAFHENPGHVDLTKYLWVGRFEREERAEEHAKRIRDLGLSAEVVPRNTAQGHVFIVVSGPFGPDQMDSVQEWLKTQGFPNVRPLKRPNAFPDLDENQPRSSGGAPIQNP